MTEARFLAVKFRPEQFSIEGILASQFKNGVWRDDDGKNWRVTAHGWMGREDGFDKFKIELEEAA